MSRSKRTALALALLIGMGTSALAVPQAAMASNSITLYRIYPDKTHTVQQLANEGIDIWQEQPNFVEAMLTPDQLTWLQANGWSYAMSRQANGPSFDSSYRTYDQIRSVLSDQAGSYRNLMSVVTIGTSFEGRPIQAVKITSGKIRADKPKSLWIGGTHAREIAPPEVMMANIEYLLTGYGVDPDVTWMLDTREVWVVPVLNPDGHARAERLLNWRKNADTRWGSTGVDLNRNYDEVFAGIWGNPLYGTSQNPLSDIYCGPYAFSEPETQAVRNLVESVMGPSGTPATHPNGFRLLVDMHSFGNLIMWPWNWTNDITQGGAAAEIGQMEQIGRKWATYNTYKPQIGSKLYATTGDTTDWAFGAHRIPSFTFEIAKSFWPSSGELPGLIAENRLPFLSGIKMQDDPYGRVQGPDVLGLTASVEAGRIVLAGTADDRNNGGQDIKGVEVFIDRLGARGTGLPGVVGSASAAGAAKAFTLALPAAGLPSGKHLLIVEAQDATGAWGAPSAVWVQLP